ncbi:MAG: ThiF family adenylyltransferase [Actinomycetota bacterium]
MSILAGQDVVDTPTGQTLILAAVNMAARVHRRIAIDIPDAELLVPTLVAATSLRDAAFALALAIDPFLDLRDTGEKEAPSLGIGQRAGSVNVGAKGYRASVSVGSLLIGDHPAGILGAGLAACLGTSALLQLVTGQIPAERVVSLWCFGEGDLDEVGPEVPVGPLKVGERVALIGAGAVGSAIAYWLRLIGVEGEWVFVDHDEVELHNTNRSIGQLVEDAGWAAGLPGGIPRGKANVAAELIGGYHFDGWYDEWIQDARRPDLIIPVANDRGLRQVIGRLGMPLLMHGATSANWTAELHRHGPRDDCPACRFPHNTIPDFGCSEGPLDPGIEKEESPDAALPFLSAAAGLLVVAGLTQLENGYLDVRHNHHRLLFQSAINTSWLNTIHSCHDGCRIRPTPGVRRQLNRGRRWGHLD